MHPIQKALLELAGRENLAKLTLRRMAELLGRPGESPQKIKHHLGQLRKKGFLSVDRTIGSVVVTSLRAHRADGLGMTPATLLSIPIVGAANCGPAMLDAVESIEGFLRVSTKLLGRSNPQGLYALRAVGLSMNTAVVEGRAIDDGDMVIVDSRRITPHNLEVVVAIIDNRATLKRFYLDEANHQVVLHADSDQDYEPIHLHPDDDFSISGTVIRVLKRPHIATAWERDHSPR